MSSKVLLTLLLLAIIAHFAVADFAKGNVVHMDELVNTLARIANDDPFDEEEIDVRRRGGLLRKMKGLARGGKATKAAKLYKVIDKLPDLDLNGGEEDQNDEEAEIVGGGRRVLLKVLATGLVRAVNDLLRLKSLPDRDLISGREANKDEEAEIVGGGRRALLKVLATDTGRVAKGLFRGAKKSSKLSKVSNKLPDSDLIGGEANNDEEAVGGGRRALLKVLAKGIGRVAKVLGLFRKKSSKLPASGLKGGREANNDEEVGWELTKYFHSKGY